VGDSDSLPGPRNRSQGSHRVALTISLDAQLFRLGEDMNAFKTFVDRRAFLKGTACNCGGSLWTKLCHRKKS
jgi:hypothetical protein